MRPLSLPPSSAAGRSAPAAAAAGQPTLKAHESVACMGCPALADWVKGWVAFAEWLCVLHQVGVTWCEGDVGQSRHSGRHSSIRLR